MIRRLAPLLLLVITGAACRVPFPVTIEAVDTVWVGGDSQTWHSRHAIAGQMNAIAAAKIDGVPTYTTDQLMPYAERAATLTPSQVIVFLGQNDNNYGQDPAETRAEYDQMLALFDEARCRHVVTLYPYAPNGVGSINKEFNAWLRAKVDADPSLRLIDYAAWVESYVASGKAMVEPLTLDGLHPAPIAQEWLAEHMAASVTSCD